MAGLTPTDLIVLCTFQVTIPVFFVHLGSFMWQYSRPPNPGLFAWLQRLHNIDLSNRVKSTCCSRFSKYSLGSGIFSNPIQENFMTFPEPAIFHRSVAKIMPSLIGEQESKAIYVIL